MIYKLDITNVNRIKTVGRVKYKEGWRRGHTFKHSDALFFVTEGEIVFNVGGESISISEGQIRFFPKNTKYTVKATRDCDFFYLHLSPLQSAVRVDDSELQMFAEQSIRQDATKPKVKELPAFYIDDSYDFSDDPDMKGRLVHLFTKCANAIADNAVYSAVNAGCITVQLVSMLAETTVSNAAGKDTRPVVLLKVLEYIRNNYTKPVTLTELCEVCGVSKQYVMRLFRKYYGMTVTSYVNCYKLEKSKHMLKYTNLNIDEIAFALGYSAAYYYCRLFKRFYGLTPTEYRKNEATV